MLVACSGSGYKNSSSDSSLSLSLLISWWLSNLLSLLVGNTCDEGDSDGGSYTMHGKCLPNLYLDNNLPEF